MNVLFEFKLYKIIGKKEDLIIFPKVFVNGWWVQNCQGLGGGFGDRFEVRWLVRGAGF